jgi:hypothetical protein
LYGFPNRTSASYFGVNREVVIRAAHCRKEQQEWQWASYT